MICLKKRRLWSIDIIKTFEDQNYRDFMHAVFHADSVSTQFQITNNSGITISDHANSTRETRKRIRRLFTSQIEDKATVFLHVSFVSILYTY